MRNPYNHEYLSRNLVRDERTYPYIVILLLMRGGLTQAVTTYCQQHRNADIV